MVEKPDSFIPTRRSLLTRLKNWSDEASWRRFFDVYGKLIYTTAVKAGLTKDEAEEALQETIITVAKKFKEQKYHYDRRQRQCMKRSGADKPAGSRGGTPKA